MDFLSNRTRFSVFVIAAILQLALIIDIHALPLDIPLHNGVIASPPSSQQSNNDFNQPKPADDSLSSTSQPPDPATIQSTASTAPTSTSTIDATQPQKSAISSLIHEASLLVDRHLILNGHRIGGQEIQPGAVQNAIVPPPVTQGPVTSAPAVPQQNVPALADNDSKSASPANQNQSSTTTQTQNTHNVDSNKAVPSSPKVQVATTDTHPTKDPKPDAAASSAPNQTKDQPKTEASSDPAVASKEDLGKERDDHSDVLSWAIPVPIIIVVFLAGLGMIAWLWLRTQKTQKKKEKEEEEKRASQAQLQRASEVSTTTAGGAGAGPPTPTKNFTTPTSAYMPESHLARSSEPPVPLKDISQGDSKSPNQSSSPTRPNPTVAALTRLNISASREDYDYSLPSPTAAPRSNNESPFHDHSEASSFDEDVYSESEMSSVPLSPAADSFYHHNNNEEDYDDVSTQRSKSYASTNYDMVKWDDLVRNEEGEAGVDNRTTMASFNTMFQAYDERSSVITDDSSAGNLPWSPQDKIGKGVRH